MAAGGVQTRGPLIMETKFTPGPWVWGDWTILDEDRPAQKRGEPYWTLVERDPEVCDCYLAQGPPGRKVIDPECIAQARGHEVDGIGVSEADAALIAAAPDLFDALHKLLLWAATQEGCGEELDNAKSALIKAMGK